MQDPIVIGRRHGNVDDAGSKGMKRMLTVIPEVSVLGEEDFLLLFGKSKNIRILPAFVRRGDLVNADSCCPNFSKDGF